MKAPEIYRVRLHPGIEVLAFALLVHLVSEQVGGWLGGATILVAALMVLIEPRSST